MKATQRVAQLVGSGGFKAADRWDSGGDVEPEGSALMSRIVVFSPVRELGAVGQIVFTKVAAAGAGWSMHWTNLQRYRFYIRDGVPTTRFAQLIPTAVPQKDECVVLCGSYNETNIHVYAKGESASAGPYVGYTATNVDVAIGARGDGVNPALDFNVLACLATDTYALSVAECAVAEAAIKTMLEQGQRIDPAKLPGTGWGWIWDARDIHKAKKGEWADQESGVILAEAGETQLHAIEPRFA